MREAVILFIKFQISVQILFHHETRRYHWRYYNRNNFEGVTLIIVGIPEQCHAFTDKMIISRGRSLALDQTLNNLNITKNQPQAINVIALEIKFSKIFS